MFENYEDKVTYNSDLQKKHVLTETEIAQNKDMELRTKIDQAKYANTHIVDTPVNLAPSSSSSSSSSSASPDNLTDSFNYLFNQQNLMFLLWFLGIYFIAYFGLGYFFNKGGEPSNFQLNLSRTLDVLFLIIFLFILISLYFSYTPLQQQNIFVGAITNTTSFLDDPISIFTMILFLIVFYTITYLFRVPMTADVKPLFISFIENGAWILLVIIAFVDFFKYILGVSFSDLFSNFNWWKTPDAMPIVTDNSNNNISRPLPVDTNEVFNISNNLYTYDDAQSICTAYGAKLATYDQIEDAYKKGGEWCNYGWSDGQMIFFPTQKSTWQELQKNEKHKNDCGRPGINGGYNANPSVKFGVNCFGKKPQPSAADLERVNAEEIPAVKPEDAALNAKIKYWKDNAAQLLKINSFNKTEWSEY